jgi:putative transposase
MALRMLYLVFHRLLGLLLLLSCSEAVKEAEVLALRHEVVLNGLIHEYRNAA